MELKEDRDEKLKGRTMEFIQSEQQKRIGNPLFLHLPLPPKKERTEP